MTKKQTSLWSEAPPRVPRYQAVKLAMLKGEMEMTLEPCFAGTTHRISSQGYPVGEFHQCPYAKHGYAFRLTIHATPLSATVGRWSRRWLGEPSRVVRKSRRHPFTTYYWDTP